MRTTSTTTMYHLVRKNGFSNGDFLTLDEALAIYQEIAPHRKKRFFITIEERTTYFENGEFIGRETIETPVKMEG